MVSFVAGTFDRLHTGHEALLSAAFSEGRRVIIGLTSDRFIRKFKIKNSLQISNSTLEIGGYDGRKKNLEQWLKNHGVTGRYTIIPIDDPYEPLASMEEVGAIVVSSETRGRAQQINQLRKKRGLRALRIIEVALVPAEDLEKISSTRVRAGDITVRGKLVMPDNLRPELSAPMGEIWSGSRVAEVLETYRHAKVVTVGDLATKTLLVAGIEPFLSVIDGKVERKPFPDALTLLTKRHIPLTNLTSGPGYISAAALLAVQEALVQAQRAASRAIVVSGEEDLLALPGIAFSPVGAVVFYGQPGMGSQKPGLVCVPVTEETKLRAARLLRRFVREEG